MNTNLQINTNQFSELVEIISESKSFLFVINLIYLLLFIVSNILLFINLFLYKVKLIKNIKKNFYPGILIETV